MNTRYYMEFSEAQKEAANNQYANMNLSLIGGLVEASNGLILDFNTLESLLDYYFRDTLRVDKFNPEYIKYKESLKTINYLSRRAQYYDYATATPEQLETFRMAEIKHLQDTATVAERVAPTLQIDLNSPVNGNTKFDVTKNQTKNDAYMLRQPSGIESVVSNLDSYSMESNESRKSVLKTMATSDYQVLKSKIAALSSLTIEQYKAYRINQIALSEEEIAKMQQDLQNNPSLLEQVSMQESAGKTM